MTHSGSQEVNVVTKADTAKASLVHLSSIKYMRGKRNGLSPKPGSRGVFKDIMRSLHLSAPAPEVQCNFVTTLERCWPGALQEKLNLLYTLTNVPVAHILRQDFIV
ncbi:hypothetical protein GOODEAATRI_024190 [Goodea atripinnis]|uniref:Uncharacterized protein n=1 Tax=Goodea atripinnis TaxID=208336 RepID=A0ABV0MKP5_9TELE